MSLQTSLTALANSIRTKSGATGSLSIDGMKTAVDSIQTGGGGEKVKIINGSMLFGNPSPPAYPIYAQMVKALDFSELQNGYGMFFGDSITDDWIDWSSFTSTVCSNYNLTFNHVAITYADLSAFHFNDSTNSLKIFSFCSALQKVWIPSTLNLPTVKTNSYGWLFADCPTTLEIYTDAVTLPDNFGTYWNCSFMATTPYTTHWGATHEEFMNA